MTENDETGRVNQAKMATADGGELAVDGSSPSERVIDAMSAATGSEPIALDPLGEVVDTDALDALFSSQFDGTQRTGGSVTLEYCGRRVTTRPDGTIVIDKPSED